LRYQVGQDHQMIFVQFGLGAATVRERSDVPMFALLAKQFIDEGFVNAEQLGNFTDGLGSAFLNSVKDSFPKV
jgi:hypothetical protein